MKVKIIILMAAILLFLSACDAGKEDVIEEIKYDLSVEYNIPISDIEIELIEYGVTKFTTNQFKATIKSLETTLYLVDKGSNNYRRVPIDN